MPARLGSAVASWGWLAIVFVAVAIFWRSVTGAYFFEDDFVYLYRAADLHLAELLLTPQSGHVIPLRNLLYLIQFAIFGPDAKAFLTVVLLTHAVNAVLFALLLYRLTGRRDLALWMALLWGLIPGHASTLGWYAVYGQVLMTTFVLALLIAATREPAASSSQLRWPIALWIAAVVAVATLFAIGAAVAVALPLVISLVSPRPRPWIVRSLVAASGIVVLYIVAYANFGPMDPLGGEALLKIVHPESLPAPGSADGALHGFGSFLPDAASILRMFGLLLRSAVSFVTAALLPASDFALTSLVFGIVLLVGSGTGLGFGSGSTRRHIGAALLLIGACYVAIAVGRARFYASGSVEWMSKSSRYHYLGSLGVVMIVGILAAPVARWRAMAWLRWPAVVLGVALAVMLLMNPIRIRDHRAARNATERFIKRVRTAAHAVPDGEVVVLRNYGFDGTILPFRREAFPDEAAAYVIFFPQSSIDRRPIFFAESDPHVVAACEKRKRTHRIVRLAPQAAPANADSVDGDASPP